MTRNVNKNRMVKVLVAGVERTGYLVRQGKAHSRVQLYAKNQKFVTPDASVKTANSIKVTNDLVKQVVTEATTPEVTPVDNTSASV